MTKEGEKEEKQRRGPTERERVVEDARMRANWIKHGENEKTAKKNLEMEGTD